jgi:hypothetical protein
MCGIYNLVRSNFAASRKRKWACRETTNESASVDKSKTTALHKHHPLPSYTSTLLLFLVSICSSCHFQTRNPIPSSSTPRRGIRETLTRLCSCCNSDAPQSCELGSISLWLLPQRLSDLYWGPECPFWRGRRYTTGRFSAS